jgi:putative metallohydrolase (TIGR04338 family)
MALDYQRQRLYDAEIFVRDIVDSVAHHDVPTFDFYGSSLLIPIDRKFGDLESVQRYVDYVLALDWVKEAWPTRAAIRITVRSRNSNNRAHYEGDKHTLAIRPHKPGKPSHAMRELYLLHEITHHLIRGAVSHSPAFAGAYLRLVTEIVGPEVGLLLTDAYTRHEVQYRTPATV